MYILDNKSIYTYFFALGGRFLIINGVFFAFVLLSISVLCLGGVFFGGGGI